MSDTDEFVRSVEVITILDTSTSSNKSTSQYAPNQTRAIDCQINAKEKNNVDIQ